MAVLVFFMFVSLCKSKIHRLRVTQANLHYEGSLTVDEKLIEAAGILPYEKVSVVNVNNGARLETYVILGERESGVVCLNGAAARLGQVGDVVIIIAYAFFEGEEIPRSFAPLVVHVDEKNHVTKVSGGDFGSV